MNHSFNSHRIRCISIIGGFLDGTKFELADGLNCFIGARGAGETTMLEFVRYALDATPSREEQPIERRRIESLVEKNLAGGHVEVTIETKDGMQYIVSRSSGDEPIVLTIDRQPTDISFKTGMVFGADIYSQNEVETIADCKASQRALLDKFQADSIAEIESRIDHITSQLAANANQIVTVQQRIAALTDEPATLASVEEKLARLGAYTGLIGFFSAQGPLAGRFKMRPCFYPSSQGDPAYVSLSVLENRPDLCRTDRLGRAIQCSRLAVPQLIGCSPMTSCYQWKRKLAATPQTSVFLCVQASGPTEDSIEIKLPEAGERLEAIGVREQPGAGVRCET